MRALPFLLLAVCLAACGQTGDLYLPQKTPPPSAQQDDANKKKGQVPPPSQPDPQPVPQEVR